MVAKARVAILVVAVLGALALAACSSQNGQSSSTTPSSTTPSISASSSSASSIPASSASSSTSLPETGRTYTIDLDYNAGTGYEWTYGLDQEGIVELVDQTTTSLGEANVSGGPLQDRFTFRALQPGEVVITFELARSWEADAPPAETQVYAFTVNDNMEMILNPYKSNFD